MSEEKLQERPVWNADNPPVSRRALFRMASQQGRLALARGLSKDSGDGDSPLSRERLRVLAALERLATEETAAAGPRLDGMGFASVSVSESCTACGTCARACPTDALQFQKKGMRYRLTFSPQACVGCEICADVLLPDTF